MSVAIAWNTLDAVTAYDTALAALAARGAELAVRRKFDLAHMRSLAAALGNPQQRFNSVLIAGTNGKGSTAATLASICRAAGLRTGLYTSPHLTRVNERICLWNVAGPAETLPLSRGVSPVAGGAIPDPLFAELFAKVDAASAELVRRGDLPHIPSFFETLTAMAFCAFAQARVDLAILEVGLGGRLDATNIVEPLVSVITDIDYDHMEWLGPTLADIAREKAGILRDHGTLVTLPQHPAVNTVIGEEAMRREVTAISAADYVPNRPETAGFRNRYTLNIDGEAMEVDSPLSGQHQQRNIALAVCTAVQLRNQCGYNIKNVEIQQGIRETFWPGRLELLPATAARPAVLLDVAHNPAGAWTLRAALSSLEQERGYVRRTLLFGCLADKPLAELAQIMFPMFPPASHHTDSTHKNTGPGPAVSGPDEAVTGPAELVSAPGQAASGEIILTRPNSPRAADPDVLAKLAAQAGALVTVVPRPDHALRYALAATPKDGLLVCAGSVYLVGELRPLLLG